MAINFPNNPLDGATYTFNNVGYRFIRPNLSNTGYWAVATPATAGLATPTDIDAGSDNSKYITPLGLDGSKYVREDQTSGNTELKHKGSTRVKTTNTGVEMTGNVLINGVPLADYIKSIV